MSDTPKMDGDMAGSAGAHATEQRLAPHTSPDESCGRDLAVSSRNYFARHWRGELSLAIAFWINGVALNVLLAIATLLFLAIVQLSRTNASFAAAVIGFSLSVAPILVWQVVGIWRCASRHRNHSGRALWADLARVAIVFGALGSVVQLAQPLLTIALDYAQDALSDTEMAETQFSILRNGTELELSGPITFGTDRRFAQLLDAATQVAVVRLKSHGGRIGEADRIARLVRKRKLVTYVPHYCESACTHIFLAGQERWIRKDAKLGFHQPTYSKLNPLERRIVIHGERAWLLEAGLPADFADRAAATPPSSMWYPSPEELLAARAISGVDNGNFASSQDFASLAASNRWDRLLERSPEIVRLRDKNPDLYRQVAKNFSEAFRQGLSDDETEAMAQEMFDKIIDDYLSRASDEALLEYNEIKLSYMKGLTDRDPEICVTLSTNHEGAHYKADGLKALLPEISKREGAFNLKLLEDGRGDATTPSSEEIQSILDKIEPIVARNPNWEDNLDLPTTLTPEQFKPACDKAIAFFEAVQQLPPQEAAALLRYLNSPDQP